MDILYYHSWHSQPHTLVNARSLSAIIIATTISNQHELSLGPTPDTIRPFRPTEHCSVILRLSILNVPRHRAVLSLPTITQHQWFIYTRSGSRPIRHELILLQSMCGDGGLQQPLNKCRPSRMQKPKPGGNLGPHIITVASLTCLSTDKRISAIKRAKKTARKSLREIHTCTIRVHTTSWKVTCPSEHEHEGFAWELISKSLSYRIVTTWQRLEWRNCPMSQSSGISTWLHLLESHIYYYVWSGCIWNAPGLSSSWIGVILYFDDLIWSIHQLILSLLLLFVDLRLRYPDSASLLLLFMYLVSDS